MSDNPPIRHDDDDPDAPIHRQHTVGWSITTIARRNLVVAQQKAKDQTEARDKAQKALEAEQKVLDLATDRLAYWERMYEAITTFDEHGPEQETLG